MKPKLNIDTQKTPYELLSQKQKMLLINDLLTSYSGQVLLSYMRESADAVALMKTSSEHGLKYLGKNELIASLVQIQRKCKSELNRMPDDWLSYLEQKETI